MKKISVLLSLLIVAMAVPASARGKFSLRNRNNNRPTPAATVKVNRGDSIFESVRQQYTAGRISADSVVNLALYHKGWSPELAAKCLGIVADHSPRATMELGVLYAFSPEFSKQKSEGVKLLQKSAGEGYNDANCYLGLYYFSNKDYKKAKAYFDACNPIQYGFGDTALGSMYLAGYGVKSDPVKARQYYHLAAEKGYPRGMALYGFNLRATAGGNINYPDAFFWLYISGDLGDDAARTVLRLPRVNENRGDSEESRDAALALQWIEAAQSGTKIQNDPIYKDGFLPSLKARERQAEQGDDWARYYLGSMNYNGDFLNQNYAQVLRYYEPIAQNGKLPKNVLAVVHERLAKIYREGLGTTANPAKAAYHAQAAANYGSLPAYIIIENITD